MLAFLRRTVLFLFLFLSYLGVNANQDSSLFFMIKGQEYFISGDYINCENNWKKALEIRLKKYSLSSEYVGHAYNNLGVLYLKTWEFDKSIAYLEKAKEIYLKNNLEVHIANVNSNLGANYHSIGNYDLAEQYFFKALELLSNIQSQEAEEREASTLNRMGLLEYQRGNFQVSANYFNRALRSENKNIERYTIINLYLNLSKCYLEMEKYDSTYNTLEKTLDLTNNNSELPSLYLFRIYRAFSEYYSYTDNKNMSISYLKKTKSLLETLNIDSSNYFYLYMDIAEHYSTFNQYDSSLIYFQKSLGIITTESIQCNISTPEATNFLNPIKGIKLIRKKTEILIKSFASNPDPNILISVIQSLNVASTLIDQSRNGYLSLESKLALAENESSIYQYGIHTPSLLLGLTNEKEYLEQAYFFSEKSKSSILESTIQEQKAKTFANIPDSLLQTEEKYKRDIAFYKEMVYSEKLKKEPEKQKLNKWQSTLLSINEDYERLKNTLEKNFPAYYKLKYVSPYSSLTEVQKHLDANTTLLEYALTDSILYIFQIDKENTLLHTQKIDSLFYKQITLFLNQFKHFDYISQGKKIYAEYQSAGSQLYEYLIGSVHVNLLKENLVIIPDNILSYIPFEALVKPSDKMPESYVDMHYLLYDHTISYSYSAHLFVENNLKSGRKFWNKALSVAPQYKHSSKSIPVLAQDIYRSKRDNLDPLPFALEEANLVSKITLGHELSGSDATEENFLEFAPNFNILHLAMHTLIDDKNPLYSRLVFYADSTDSDAGFLTTNEIFSLKLKADMTVLSACSSGEGEYRKGEGVLSLARSFFYAGCPSLVMTLWNVDDESGLRLMKDYYKHLRTGYSKAKAMQLAKIEYISKISPDKQHPFYWSNYICIGNSSALYFPVWLYFVLTGLLALFPVIQYGIRYNKNKQKMILSEPNITNGNIVKGDK